MSTTPAYLLPDDYVEAPDGIDCWVCLGSGDIDAGDGDYGTGPQIHPRSKCYGTGRVPALSALDGASPLARAAFQVYACAEDETYDDALLGPLMELEGAIADELGVTIHDVAAMCKEARDL